MVFSKDVLNINPEEISLKLTEFIRDTVIKRYRRKGIVVGLSGGLDSSVCAYLSVKALGAGRVVGFLLPEKDSNPVSREYGLKLAESIGIECHEVDLSPMLKSFGVYDKRDAIVKKVFPGIKGKYKFRLVLPQDLLDRDRLNVYHIEIMLKDGTVKSERLSHRDYLYLMAANDIKQRLRMTQLYYEAEKRYYIVCGTTNYSETNQGFFVKYGDGGTDIEPIAYLYKVQVFELAKYLGVPDEIIERTPSPDTYSYPVSDKDFYFCLPYDLLDYILYGVEHDIPTIDMAEALGLEQVQVERARKDLLHKREATRHLREMPPAPELSF